jgi:hypothetical protein
VVIAGGELLIGLALIGRGLRQRAAGDHHVVIQVASGCR